MIKANQEILEERQSPATTSSLRNRMLALAVGAIIIAILVTTLVAVDIARSVIRQANETSSESLRTQAQAYLLQINDSIASQNNLILDRAERDVKTAAENAAAIYQSDLPADLSQTREKLDDGPDGQYLNRQEDISSVFIPNTQLLTDPVLLDVELGRYFDLMLPSIKENNPNAAAIYLGTVNDVTRYYPNIMLGEVVPANFQVTRRPWYVACLEENAGKSAAAPVWSPVYQDATGLGLVTTVAMPVQDSTKKLLGVVGLDLTLDEISKNIETARFLKTGYSFLVDESGHAIVFPEQGYRYMLGREPRKDEFAPDLNSSPDPNFRNILEKMRFGETGLMSLQKADQEFFIAFSPLESTGWSLGSVVAADDVLQSIALLEEELRSTSRDVLFKRAAPIGALISIALLLITILLTNRLVNPIRKLAQSAEQIGSGLRDVDIPIKGNDEIGLLGRTLDRMAGQIRRSFDELEQRVAERTQQLEKRTLQLEAAAEIASDITTSADLEALLERAVNLISDRFGYYNVGIFLVDEAGEYAHLRSVSGTLGKKLLHEKIKMRVGQQGMVGYVTQFGQIRLAKDVLEDQLYQAEPHLEDTRSELVIPLKSAGEKQNISGEAGTGPRAIIGALDVQSTEINAFNPDEITALQVLADQLAVAIQNMRLVDRLQSTLKELNLFNQQQVRETWQTNTSGEQGLAFLYDQFEVKPTTPLSASLETQPVETLAPGDRAIIPIRLRDQVIGYIGLENDDRRHVWTEDELAVLRATAEQAALTVENARLLAESQRKAIREELGAEIIARIRASLDVETVIRTAMLETAQKLGISQVDIHLGADDLSGDQKQSNDHVDSRRTLKGNGSHE